MDLRSALSTLFFAGGLLFFVLAAINFWNSSGQEEGIPIDAITSTREANVDLQRITSRPLTSDSAPDLRNLDILSLVFLHANYDCGICSRRTAKYIHAVVNHTTFEELSVKTSTVIVEPDVRTATHFARAQQFGAPAFHSPEIPPSIRDSTKGRCFVVLVDPQTEKAFFKVYLSRVPVTVRSDAVFKAAHKAYRQYTLNLASR